MDDEQGGTYTYTSPPCSENIKGSSNHDIGIHYVDSVISDRDSNINRNTVLDGMMENGRDFGTPVSKRRKRLSEIVDRLMLERKISISEVDSSQWNQLIRDAEAILFNEERFI